MDVFQAASKSRNVLFEGGLLWESRPAFVLVYAPVLVGGLGKTVMILETLPVQSEEIFTRFRISSDR